METQSSLSIPWLNEVLNSNWWPILLPLGYGIFRFGEYLLKRKVEKRPESEKIEQYSKLLDLQKRLDENNMSIADLNSLRGQILSEQAASAINVAEQYADVAKHLVADTRSAEYPLADQLAPGGNDWDEPLTQADMNALSAEKAHQADRELTALVLGLMEHLSPEDAAWLQRAQDHWYAFRRTESQREAKAWEGGSIVPLIVNAKFEAMTRERIAALLGEVASQNCSELRTLRVATPRDLLRHLEQGVPKERVSELLGAPTYVQENRWLYRYEETRVEIAFDEGASLSDVVIALCHGQVYAGYNPIVDIPLGKLKLADLLRIDPQATVEYRWSMRTEEIVVHLRTGPPGAWNDCYFGALSVSSGAGNLQSTFFEWDREGNRVVTDPQDVLINWTGLSSASEAPYFNWFIR